MSKKKSESEAETAPQAFVEMLREYAHAHQAWQRNIGGNVEPPLWEATTARVRFAEQWLLNWAKEHA